MSKALAIRIAQIIVSVHRLLKPIKRAVLLAAFGQVSECRQNPSCSEYMLRETQKNGGSGVWRGLKRIGRFF